METLMRKLTALCMLTGMLAQMFVTTLPAVGAGEEEGSLPVLQGVAKCKKTDESQHFTFKDHNGQHYTGQYLYGGKDVPFSADLTSEDGKLILTGLVTLPEPAKPEPFTMTLKGDRGWVLEIFDHEFEMAFENIPFRGQDYTIPVGQGFHSDMVWIDEGYWIGKYEVPQNLYTLIMGLNPSATKGADLPVGNISRQWAMGFCKKLTEIEKEAGRLPAGYKYTLPTKEQWVYAYRAGTVGGYSKEQVAAQGWFEGNSGGQLHPVGQKEANAWGIHDMIGNAAEWIIDGDPMGGCCIFPAERCVLKQTSTPLPTPTPGFVMSDDPLSRQIQRFVADDIRRSHEWEVKCSSCRGFRIVLSRVQ